jgi:hypothetical protein
VWIVYVADKDVFYVNCDSVWSRTEHFYGPFKGNPFKRFGLEAVRRASGVRAGAPGATAGLSSSAVCEGLIGGSSGGEFRGHNT